MKKIIEKIPLLWLIVGIVVVGSYFYGYKVLLRSDNQIQQTKKVLHPFQSKNESQKLQQEKSKQASFDESQIQPITPAQYANAQLNYEKLVNDWGIGSVFIPSSNIHSKILTGMSNDNLMVGLGTYYPNQQLGKGNFVMMAHNLVQGGGVLRDLPQTTVGSVIYATDFATIYEYMVDVNRTVDQSEGHLLDIPKQENLALMTIFRCEGGLHTPNRALIQAVFHKSYPVSEGSSVVKENLGLEKPSDVPRSQLKDGTYKANQKGTEKIPTKQTPGTNKGKQKKFLVKKSVYSDMEKCSLQLFKLLNTHPLMMGLIFIFGLLIFVYVSNHMKRIV